MSSVGRKNRSFKSIRRADLQRLAEFARTDRHEFFEARPDWACDYRDRFLCSALCQGAALHYLNGEVGINDFDLYHFFTTNPKRHWCYRRPPRVFDFGNERFGRTVKYEDFVGRRVDVMGRDLIARKGADPVEAVQIYLQAGRTKTSRLLAEKAVVLLEPEELLGKVAWPIQ